MKSLFFKCATCLTVYDASNAVCRQKADHSHTGSRHVLSFHLADSIAKTLVFSIIDVQRQEVKGGDEELHEKGAT